MTWLQRLNKWWKKNIIHHGESDDISDRTGMSENDMSKDLTEDEFQNYLRNISGPSRKALDTADGRTVFRDKNSSFNTNFAKGMATIAAALFGGSFIDFSKLGSSESAQTASRSSGWSNLLNTLFGNRQSATGGGSSIMDSILGVGSQYASSLLNYQNMEKLIDKQNVYNTPSQQMQRFADAGLNPNLVYGMGNNGNQPASGSIAPVDFDTSQREARLARMQIDTTMKQADALYQEKMANINLINNQADESKERKLAQSLQNRTFIYTWSAEQANRLAEYRRIINGINNDNKRVSFEEELKDAQVALDKFRAQPEYMQKLGSAEDAMDFVEQLLNKLGQRLQSYSPDNLYYNESTGRWEKYDVRHGDNMRGVGSNF